MITLENGNIIETVRRDRKTYLGGSDIAPLMGCYKFGKTPLSVYNSKIYGIDLEDTRGFRLARESEESIFDFFVQEIGVNFKEVVHDVNVYCKEFDFKGAQIDFLCVNQADKLEIVEIKKIKSFTFEEFKQGFPEHYLYQCAWQRMLTGAKKVYLYAYCEDLDKSILYTYEEDKELESSIDDVVNIFWAIHILANDPPEAVNLEDLDQLYTAEEGKSIECPLDAIKILSDIKDLKAEKSDIEKKISELEFSVKLLMKDATQLVFDDEVIATLKPVNRIYFNADKFKEDMPEIYEKYRETQTTKPVLRIRGV